jgi:hypothetical protein
VAAGGGLEQCGHLRRARVVRVPWGGSLFVQPCTSHANMIQGVSNGRRGEGEGVFWDGGGGGKCEGAKVGKARATERLSERATARGQLRPTTAGGSSQNFALLSSPCLTADLNLNTGFGSCRMRGRSCASGRRG